MILAHYPSTESINGVKQLLHHHIHNLRMTLHNLKHLGSIPVVHPTRHAIFAEQFYGISEVGYR